VLKSNLPAIPWEENKASDTPAADLGAEVVLFFYNPCLTKHFFIYFTCSCGFCWLVSEGRVSLEISDMFLCTYKGEREEELCDAH
jgi:hypothetical protein